MSIRVIDTFGALRGGIETLVASVAGIDRAGADSRLDGPDDLGASCCDGRHV